MVIKLILICNIIIDTSHSHRQSSIYPNVLVVDADVLLLMLCLSLFSLMSLISAHFHLERKKEIIFYLSTSSFASRI